MPQRSAPALPSDTVDVWRIGLGATEAVIASQKTLLSPEEQKRAERFVYDRHRNGFVLARAALRRVLAGYAKAAPEQLQFAYGPHGKPHLLPEGQPLAFNLSHSGACALLAVSLRKTVGVDVEQVKTERACVDIARRFFAPAEVAAFQALPHAQWVDAFFNGWTRKEAYIKALGKGLALPLDQFVVSLAPDAPVALLETAWQPTDVARWAMFALQPGAGYVGALIAERPVAAVRCWQWAPSSFNP